LNAVTGECAPGSPHALDIMMQSGDRRMDDGSETSGCDDACF
jgi:hypothetical protein